MIMSRHIIVLFFTCLGILLPTGVFSQWIPTNGPYTGDIRTIQHIDDTLYAIAGINPRMYRSNDLGLHWKIMSDTLVLVNLMDRGKTILAGLYNPCRSNDRE